VHRELGAARCAIYMVRGRDAPWPHDSPSSKRAWTYDVNDQKIGSIAEIYDAGTTGRSHGGGGYLRIPTGFLGLGKEHHLSFSAISRISEDRVYLNVLISWGTTRRPPMSTKRPQRTRPSRGGESFSCARRSDCPQADGADGRGGLQKEVVSEQRTLQVPVTYEEVVVERRAVDHRPTDQPVGETSGVIRVPVREEEVTLEKQPVVYEEVCFQ
jgi:hypothetical protein